MVPGLPIGPGPRQDTNFQRDCAMAEMYKQGVAQREIAKQFGLTTARVSQIVSSSKFHF
jgi:hypothetical protein